MKRILLLLLTAFSIGAKAQVYNNEWIDYSKTYYKFKVAVTGLYRISQPTLAAIGIGATPAEHFQLWRNGQQVPIYTSVQTGTMSSSDYIEFWGEMNDGKPDNELYRLPDYQLNDKWSLQTDTAAYFLTVNFSGSNLHLQPTINNVAGNTLSPEPYFMRTEGLYYQHRINNGRAELVGDSYTYSSSYDYGEGWTSYDFAAGVSYSNTFGPIYFYPGGSAPAPVVKVNAAGNAVHPRYFRVRVNGDSVGGQAINYYDYAKLSTTIPGSLLSTTGSFVNMEVTNMGTEPNDRMVVATVELIYPSQFNFGGASNYNFELPANTSGNYLEIAGFAYSGPTPVLYDLTNGKRYDANITNPSLLKFALLPSAVKRKLVLVNQTAANIKPVTSLQQRNFINFGLAANQANYIIISHPFLTIGANGTNPIDEYKNYRSSAAGGSYNAKVYMIDQLEDQFGLGIKKHPLSIRNFLRWARATYTAPLKDVLIVGKGLSYAQFRSYESNPDVEKLSLVPTFGYPGSDNMLSTSGGSSVPLTPIGRISAINPEEVSVYLNKVKQYEQVQTLSSPVIADKSWMKDIVHVVGAGDPLTENILLTSLNGHKKIIEDTLFGGNVHTFSKGSADAVQQVQNENLEHLFSNGIGLLTYFGHSSASTLEFNLDNPLNYNNPGKYPVFNVMGCNAGNFFNFNTARFTTKETLSEKYVLAPERGAIAFLASTHLGIVHYLDIYNSRSYTAMSTTHYGKTLGEIMDETIAKVFGITTENDFYARFHCEQFTLHGDPALHMYNFAKPDYVIEAPMVKVSPNFISVNATGFDLKASFMNIGKAISDSTVIEVKRTYPDGTTEILYKHKIRGIRYIDSVSYPMQIIGSRDKGLNKITITIDPDNIVPELYETNNTVTKDVYIFEEEARPVYPYNFSIVNQQPVKFAASSANPFAELRQYKMEIDTSELFNSPAKVTQSVSSPGGVFEFNPSITLANNTVYYWRVAPEASGTGDPVWNASSFVYLDGTETGYNQSHYFQHAKSATYRNYLDSTSRKWNFDTTSNNIFARNGCWVTAVTQEQGLVISVNEQELGHNTCWFSSLVFNVFDPATLAPWRNTTITNTGNDGMGWARFGSSSNNCYDGRTINFEWRYDKPERRKLMMNFMKDTVPDGYYVVVRNFTLAPMFGFPDAWANDWAQDENLPGFGSGQSLYHYLKNAGFSGLDSFYRARPFAFVYKKNDPSFAPRFVMGDGIYDNITLSVQASGKDTAGSMVSPVFGPAKAWKEFRWEGHSLETPSTDIASASILGIAPNGTVDTLLTNITPAQAVTDISSIDPQQYPYLKMYMNNKDRANLTPYQLNYWRLYYDPVPEGAIAPNIYFNTKDTVEVGEPFSFGIGFKNVSKTDFDSVKVKITVTDKNNIEHIVPVPRQKPLTTTAPGDTIRLNVPIDTRGFSGTNYLFVNFNPDNDQPEQHLFNNFAFRTLYVRPDSLHPLLDVTFDGVHILNRDIVSSKPDILIKLKDEAKWMVLNDSSVLNLRVKYPDGTIHQFNSGNDTLQFIPAGQAPSVNNTASLSFKPYFPQDGDYELIVSGKDMSSNTAGNIEYRVGFQVINKAMISNMLNYPNPFTTSTAFVFTITGSEIPQNIRIQILTITGKIVRDITKDELGTLRIGRNITEFKWDGTDQYGQKLANGIYLYRVITNLNGKSLDKFKADGDNTDKYFNKGYGKMYLMR